MEDEWGNPNFNAQSRRCAGRKVRSIASGIRLHADLSCEFDGHAFSIKTSDDVIVVEVTDLITGVRLLRKLARPGHLPFDLKQLIDCLRLLHNTLELRVGGVCVAVAGGGNDSNFGRFISYKGMRLMPIAALRAALNWR